jgi:hypothetical protein
MEFSRPPVTKTLPVINFEAKRSLLLKELSKKKIDDFLKDYATYRQKGGLQPIERCLSPDVVKKLKELSGYQSA